MRLVAVAAVAAALAVPVGASAAPPQEASGTGTFTVTPTSTRAADGNTVFEASNSVTFTGTLTGSFSGQGHGVIKADGRLVASDHGVFTGTIGNCGTGTFPVEGTAIGTLAAFSGRRSTSSTGAHFNITFAADATTGTFTYTGTYHC
jgi:hypothetical protein